MFQIFFVTVLGLFLGTVTPDCSNIESVYHGEIQHYRIDKAKFELREPCITGIVVPPIYKMVCVRNMTVCKVEGRQKDCETDRSCTSCDEKSTFDEKEPYLLTPRSPGIIEGIESHEPSNIADEEQPEHDVDHAHKSHENHEKKVDTRHRCHESKESRHSEEWKSEPVVKHEAHEFGTEDTDPMDGLTHCKPCKCGRRWENPCTVKREIICAEWSTVTTCTTIYDHILGAQVCCKPVVEYPGTTLYVDEYNRPVEDIKFAEHGLNERSDGLPERFAEQHQ